MRCLFSGVTNRHTEDYLVWHHLGYKTSYENEDLCNMYRHFLAQLCPENLARFIQVGRGIWPAFASCYLKYKEASNDHFRFRCTARNVTWERLNCQFSLHDELSITIWLFFTQ